MILGLDVSTSITGICILSLENKIILQDSIILNKDTKKNPKKDFYDKCIALKQRLENIKAKYDIKDIVVEKKLLQFGSKKKKTNANTMSKLTSFNSVVLYLCYEIFNMKPTEYHPSSARSKAKFKKNSKSQFDIKQQILNFVLDNYSDFVVKYTRNENVCACHYDEADALILCLGKLNEKY